MQLNIKNIEFCNSQEIGKDIFNRKLKIRIDKLTLVSDFSSKSKKENIYLKLDKLPDATHNKYNVRRAFPRKNKPYRKAIIIKKKGKNSPVLLRIDYSPINFNTGEIRFDFHPQHQTSAGNDKLIMWIANKVGSDIIDTITNAWVKQVDIALDINDCRLKDYIWDLKGARKSKYYSTAKGLPGIRIGSSRSIQHILFYEKIDASDSKLKRGNVNSKHIDVDIKNHTRFLRVEARYRPKSKSKKNILGSLMLCDICKMKNPFEMIKIYSLSLIEEIKSEGVLKKCPNNSLIAIKNKVKKEMNYSRLPRNLMKSIDNNEIELFDNDSIWNNWNECIKNLSIFIFNLNDKHFPKKDD
ncbi:hypothetical protein VBL72_14395 [Enterobacter hormaechei]|uniref:hypothetical protein n=1 Tax=Enterobacter hormaechei TaxID=158836 RepID=UPI002D7E0B7B|nr:hypothetical protein [Enterobacter hormaechei]